MRDAILHEQFHRGDCLHSSSGVCASRGHIGIIQTAEQPASHDGVHVWIDGELYNRPELRARAGGDAVCCDDASLIGQLYREDETLSFLKDVDGIYSAVVVDTRRKRVHLIIDRYGLRHLYWRLEGEVFAWASEVKAFLALPTFTPHIDPESVNDFFGLGYLLEDRTWFTDVKLLPPGSVLSLGMQAGTIAILKYWGWDNIKSLPANVREDEVINELGRLFSAAVQRHSQADVPVGVSVSGGLDSRALLAAMPANGSQPIHAVTLGKHGCDDIRIAAEVARIKPAMHHVVELSSSNWLQQRTAGVWYTDGQQDLLHMHALVSVKEQRKHYAINLNGFLGDAVLGGSYLFDRRWSLAEKVNQRGRRFINEGTRLTNNFFQNRIPFFSNALMEFAFSIPETLLAHSYVYNKMLLAKYPQFFDTIPWQSTGVPISSSRALVWTSQKARGASRRLRKVAGAFGVKFEAMQDYHNYPA
jgi:asparagine synthase (glutamine-hydrolysing)